jgi:secreted trypsin-like serine protease
MRTSDLPRSPTEIMKLVAPSYFPWMSSDQKTNLANEALVSDNLACSGDSGGPVTTVYKGTSYYLGSALSGGNTRACGAGVVDDPTKAFGYFSPVYKHLDLIKAAEDFIEANSATTSKTTITCSKGKSVKKISGANPKCPKGFKKK